MKVATVVLVSSLLTASLQAGVTNLVWYRLGENDPWATISGPVTNTTDFMGGAPLKGFGAAQYYNSVSSYLEEIAGTTLCAGFNGASGFLSNAPIASATNNFCVELWVRPNTVAGGPHFIVGNGNPGSGGDGWGIYQQGADYMAVLGGVTTISPVLLNMAAVGQWAHLALVQDVDLTIFYVNGMALGSASNRPRPPTTGFTLGRHPQLPAGEFFNGSVDEARVFRFGLGEFSVSDMLFAPRAGTLPATAVTATNALLRSLVNPTGLPTSWWFEWGTTTNYGTATPHQSAGSGAGRTNFMHLLTGISGGATYHYRVVASNELGTTFGVDQTFSTPLFVNSNAGLPPILPTGSFDFWPHSAAWGDYDGDGRLDVVISASNFVTTLWRNTGSGFSHVWSFANYFGPLSWADFNNDGRLDLIRVPDIQQNNGSGFDPVSLPLSVPFGFQPIGFTTLADYDGTGRPDALFTGIFLPIGSGMNFPASRLLQQTHLGFIEANTNLTRVIGRPAWGDYDGDGRLDVALAGFTNVNTSGGLAEVWRNTGNGFSNIHAGFTNTGGSLTWGDYDNDGKLDLLRSGDSFLQPTEIWRNTGNGFSNIQAGLPGVFRGGGAWGDFDNDGRLDILLHGKTNPFSASNGTICQVWRNTGSGFALVPNSGLPGLCAGTATWGDYDNDGRLDVLLVGYTNWTAANLRPIHPVSQIWKNFTAVPNTPPGVPTGLSVELFGPAVTFRWNPASDAQTPAAGLTYNLRAGTTPGGTDIVSPMSIASGRRQVPESGNAGGRFSRTITEVPAAVPIYWSVQAVDNGFAASAFAPERVFTFNSVFTLSNGIPIPGDINGDGVVNQSELSAVLTNVNGNGVLTEENLNVVLSNYFAHSPWLQMTNVAGLGGTNVTFALTNSLAGALRVEYTTNLNSMNWQLLGPATPRYLFTDTNAPGSSPRYYRLRWP